MIQHDPEDDDYDDHMIDHPMIELSEENANQDAITNCTWDCVACQDCGCCLVDGKCEYCAEFDRCHPEAKSYAFCMGIALCLGIIWYATYLFVSM